MSEPYTYVMVHPETFLDEPGTFCEEVERDDELRAFACSRYAQAVEQTARQAAKRIVVCYDEDDAYSIQDGALPVIEGVDPTLVWDTVVVDTHQIDSAGFSVLEPMLVTGQSIMLAGAHRDDCVKRFHALLTQAGYQVALDERALLPRRSHEMDVDLGLEERAADTRFDLGL